MKKHLAFACALAGLILPFQAPAATVELLTVNAMGPDINLVQRETFQPNETEATSSILSSPGPNGEHLEATAGFAEGGKRLFASSSLFRPAQSDFIDFRTVGIATYRDQLHVLSSGKLEFMLTYGGAYSVLTDLPDRDSFAYLSASIEVKGLQSPLRSFAFQSSNLTRNEGSFLARLSDTVDVEAGDVLDVSAQLFANNGSTLDISAFIDASSRIEGLFSITALEGATFEEDLSLAPVPLPASLPLLLAGLLGLRGLHHHRSRRTKG